MDGTNGQQAERDAQRAAINRAELIARIAEAVPTDGAVAPLPGVELRRTSTPTALGHVVSYPVLCVVAQGSKEIVLGDTSYRFDPAHYLITTAELPIASRITEASPERPYLRVLLTLDPGLVGAVLVEAGPLVPQRPLTVPAINVSPLDAELLDAVVRLVRLVDAAAEARVLAPLITREIVVRLLLGAQGGRLRQLALLGGDPNRIAVAVARLRKDYTRPFRIEDLAHEVGMSVSRFHHHFRAVTALSPLQFQKQLRLQEARRLMLGDGLDATSAGAQVGYGNAAHFTREYKRLFGAPPMRDVARLRDDAGVRTGL